MLKDVKILMSRDKKRLIKCSLLLVVGLFLGYAFYLLCFKQLDDEDIVSYGWKCGEGDCILGDVLDFREGALKLNAGVIYQDGEPIAQIGLKQYRVYADSYIEVWDLHARSICIYYAKWKN